MLTPATGARASDTSLRRAGARLAALALLLLPGGALGQEAFESPATLEATTSSEEANAHFWSAVAEWENIDAATAAEHLAMALSLDPDFGLAKVIEGFSAPGLDSEASAHRITEGMADLAGATAPESLFGLGLREWGQGRTTNAQRLLALAADMVPGDPHVAYWSALARGAGAEVMSEITQRFPDFAPAYNILAYNAWNEGDRETAIEAVTRYMELLPEHPNPHDSYAEIMQWSGNLKEAGAHYRAAADLRPGFNQAYYGLAEVEWLMGNEKRARSALEAGAARAPTEAGRLNGRRALANSYLMDGKRKEAMKILREVAETAASAENAGIAALAHQEMAMADAILGDGDEIAGHLGRAAEIGGENPGQMVWTAVAYGSAGRLDEAREAAAALSETAEKSPEGSGLRTAAATANAIILLQEERAEDALALLEDSDGSDPMIRVLKAECYKDMKRSREAREMKDGVLTEATLNFFNPVETIARLRAKRL
ncbi:MAG: hypothetical protein ACE5HF_01290 [Gemmatimonadota bacterium]